MFDDRDRAVHDWLADHHGVISLAALDSLGIPESSAHSIVRRAELRSICPGVFVSGAYRVGPLQLMTAACMRNPRVAVGFTTAGQLWGLRGMSDRRVHVLAPHGSSPELPGLVVHRCRRIDAVDLAERRPDGILLTSPPRTAFDAAAVIGRRATASVIEQLLAEERCTFTTLMRTMERLYHPRRPGATTIRSVLLGRPTWRGAARSELERRFREAIEDRGLPQPLVNHRIMLPSGRSIELDLAWPQWRVAGEIDHPFWHDGAAEAGRDKRRDRALAGIGWQMVRFTDRDVVTEVRSALDDLSAVLTTRGWAA